MIIDALVTAIINLMLFAIMVAFAKYFQSIRNMNYTPPAWISVKKDGIKLFSMGIISALLYKFVVGLIGILNGTMILTINQSGITDTLILTLASSFGFLGVALFEEGLFRGYMMQVIFRKIHKLLAIVIQAMAFGLIHYTNYDQPHAWVKILDVILIGLIFGIIVVKTKSLMFVIGTHLMFDVAGQILFVDNLHEFDRAVYFQSINNFTPNTIGSLFYIEFIDLFLLSIIAILLGFLFRKDIFCKTNY
ncbi:CPBP family intramembrane glutamic endopeptidase [Desulfitobacterium sp.]|uniref:CPBP family intramembrane glutamic endopeptidase n=1 Tax=Desulfitobacterium sp. TaxID=49981 RepID=UPI002B1E9E60|nr:CPBP family intramembrane glutamic endopeptidase [Desulfitobacterium sp.]MEA4901020.1 CPBP family intramembrane glutamic endopeptidase [Desulfitobacterium sp.]